MDCTKDMDFRTVSFSDHKIVSAIFSTEPFYEPRGPSYWKLNTSILSDDLVQISVHNLIRDAKLLEKNENDFLVGWEQLKMDMKYLLIDFSIFRARKIRLFRESLERKLEQAKQELQLHPNNGVFNSQVNGLFAQIKKLEIDKVKGILLHSHYRDVCLDRCTLTTAKKLQKKSAVDRHFYALQKKDGQVEYNVRGILKEIKDQMSEVLTSGPTDGKSREEFLNESLPKISQEQKEQLDGMITAEEIQEAIFSFTKNKTPGSDGFPAEFYCVFIEVLTPILEKLFEICFSLQHMTDSMHMGSSL